MSDERHNRILDRAERWAKRHVRRGVYLETPDGRDLGLEFCERCGRKEVAELKTMGEEWEAHPLNPDEEHDGICRCDRCNVDLYGKLTEYGAADELEWIEEHGFSIRRGYDCYFWSLCDVWLPGTDEHRRLMRVAGLEDRDNG